MKVIIAGGRDFFDVERFEQGLAASGFEITTVVSGCAPGADLLGERWALAHGINVVRMPAEWSRFGPAAGPRRNATMAQIADALILFDTGGPGSADMLKRAQARGLKIHHEKIR